MPRSSKALQLQRSYHDRLAGIARDTTRLVDRTYAGMRREDLTGSFRLVIPQAAQILAMGQASAQQLTGGFYRSCSAIETGEGRAVPPLEENAGFTFDGRPVDEVLSSTPARVFYGIKIGRTVEEALRFGRFSLARTIRTEVFDAARMELNHQMDNDPKALGWEWQSRGTCEACLALDDEQVRGAGEPLDAHEQCACVQSPRFDVPQRISRPTGIDRFNNMDRAAQFAALGVGKALLVKHRRVEMSDLYMREANRQWRPRYTRRPLEDLLRLAGMDRDDLVRLITEEGLDPAKVELVAA
jgi:hypothetical protein